MVEPFMHEAPCPASAPGKLTLVGTAYGLAISGPGGTMLLDRRMLAAVGDFAITLQDLLDPDPDLELNGDELDGIGAEDEFGFEDLASRFLHGPGCPISDPGEHFAQGVA